MVSGGKSKSKVWSEQAYPKAEVFGQQKQVEQPPRLHKVVPDTLIELDIGVLDFWLCPIL